VPSINVNSNVITQINVFTVPEGGQQALIELLTQCESMEAALRVIDRLREGGWLERNRALGEAHPGLYDKVFTLEK
jgi:hypothetical protein